MGDVVGPVVEGEYEGPRDHGPFAGLLDWVKSQIVVEKTGPLEVTISPRPRVIDNEYGTMRRR